MTTTEPDNQDPTPNQNPLTIGPGHEIGLADVMPAPKRKGPKWLTTPVIVLFAVVIVLLGTTIALAVVLGGRADPLAAPTSPTVLGGRDPVALLANAAE